MGRSDASRFDHCRRRLSAMIRHSPMSNVLQVNVVIPSRASTCFPRVRHPRVSTMLRATHVRRYLAQQRSLLEPHGCTMPYRAKQAPDASSWLQPRADSYFNRLALHLDVSPLDFASQVVPGRPHQKCVSLSGIAPKAQIRVLRFLRQRQ